MNADKYFPALQQKRYEKDWYFNDTGLFLSGRFFVKTVLRYILNLIWFPMGIKNILTTIFVNDIVKMTKKVVKMTRNHVNKRLMKRINEKKERRKESGIMNIKWPEM